MDLFLPIIIVGTLSGFVFGTYEHECGHRDANKKFGVDASDPQHLKNNIFTWYCK